MQTATRPLKIKKIESPKTDLDIYIKDHYTIINMAEEVKLNQIQQFLDHIKNVIANSNHEVYKYILMWIAAVLQGPDFKTGTALVILGNEGTGKNTFFTDIIYDLMNRYSNRNGTAIEDIVEKFKVILENKKLIILNELQNTDVMTKYLNFSSDSFAELGFYENLFTFFMIREYSLKEASLSAIELFVRDNYSLIENITGPTLYSKYQEFCNENRHQVSANRTFLANIKEYTGEPKSTWDKNSQKSVKWYNIKPEYKLKFKAYHQALVDATASKDALSKVIVDATQE